MLAMAMALIRRPKVMLFDEPTANLSPKLATQVLSKIDHICKTFGITGFTTRLPLMVSDSMANLEKNYELATMEFFSF